MQAENSFLVFSVSGQRYALPLAGVRRTLRAMAITPLPGAPAIVLGIVDVAGVVIPAIDLRARFGHAARALRLSDQFIVARTATRVVALVVDAATGVMEIPLARRTPVTGLVPGSAHVSGVLTLDDGLVLIQDLDKLLSLEEDAVVDRALAVVATQHPAASAFAAAWQSP
jgi:purine-binding chemotaxis protein CheW